MLDEEGDDGTDLFSTAKVKKKQLVDENEEDSRTGKEEEFSHTVDLYIQL